jgi:hypothetical protein
MFMIQEASTHSIISEAAEDLIPNEALSIETYAEGLMDDLFNDIDNILEGRRKRPAKTVRTNYVPMQTVTVKIPEVVLPQRVHRAVKAMSPIKQQQTSTLVFNPRSVTAISKKTQQNKGSLGNFLILGATLSLAIVGTIYLIDSKWLTNFAAILIPQSSQTNQVQSVAIAPDPQAELVNYMLQSLSVIEQQGTSTNQASAKSGFPAVNLSQTNSSALPSTQPVGILPQPLSANNLPPAASRVTNVVERIYIPVYQAPQPLRPLPQVPPITAKVSPPETAKNLPTKVQTVTKSAQEKVLTATVKPPIKPQLPTIAPPKLPTAPTTVQKQVSLPSYSAELEGLLELGNKSAALFKIDGVTRQISLGESIGSSGWTLVEVANGEAIIRRNGEVRSIYAGQKL